MAPLTSQPSVDSGLIAGQKILGRSSDPEAWPGGGDTHEGNKYANTAKSGLFVNLGENFKFELGLLALASP